MAGSYPDVPDHRMLLDVDGSLLFMTLTKQDGLHRYDAGLFDLETLNNESSDNLGRTMAKDLTSYIVAFPELRDVSGLYLGFDILTPDSPDDWIDVLVEGSKDTTNGKNGAWITLYETNRVQKGSTAGWWGHTDAGDYRRYIRAIPTVTSLRALRITITAHDAETTTWDFASMHLYGSISAGQDPHRLELWHPTLDQRASGSLLDWGNVPQGSSADKTFRIKNLSGGMRADDIVLTTSVLTDADPSLPPQFYFSYRNGPFTPDAQLGNLAPNTTTALITIRRVTPSNAQLGPWALRITPQASSWREVPT